MRSEMIIKSSVLSEKSVQLSETKTYTLKVDVKATKDDVRIALKDVFGVDAVRVNTTVVRGRIQRKARQKKAGPINVKRPNFKKAFVKLKEGQVLPTLDQLPSETVSG